MVALCYWSPGQGSLKSLVVDSHGWISFYTLEAENVPVLAGMNLLENHDISFRRNEFLFVGVLKDMHAVSH